MMGRYDRNKMEIKIDGDLDFKAKISEFFIQTLSLLFFPNDNTFGKNKSGNFICIKSEKNIKSIEIFVRICYNVKAAEKKRVISGNDMKLEAGRAFYDAASEITGVRPPWGIFTGIRPAKLAGNIAGKNENGSDERMALDILTNKYLMSEAKAKLALETYRNGKNAVPNIGKKDFSLYISVPFCPTRCGYCSFVSYSTPKLLKLIPEYIKNLVRELEYIGVLTRKLQLKSVYIGGGTPAVLSAGELEVILQSVRSNFDLANILEYTVECGRADVITREKLELLKSSGVDRISINPQSLNDDILLKNGRNHTAEDFYGAYELARNTFGTACVNADCIVGLPGETGEGMIDTIERLARLRPDNITMHTLCIKKSADLKKRAEYTPDSPELNRVLDESYNILKSAGYKPYYMYRQKYAAGNLENTGFCLDGRACLYNIYMMDEIQTIFGAGAGAVTKLVRGDRIERIANYKYPFEYIAHDFQIERESNKNKLEILED